MAVIRIKNKVNAGGIPEGLTQGELAVNLSDRSLYVGGTVGNSIFISGVQSFNGATGNVLGAGLAGNTFTGLNHFQAGISAAGATIGTLIVHRGISASGGVTFHNTLHVGQTLSFGGNLVNQDGFVVSTIVSIGTTADFPEEAVTGDIVFVRGPVPTQDGIYFYNGTVWVKLTPAYNAADTNGDGIVNGVDLATILAGWTTYAQNFTNPDPGITRAKFEIGLEDLYDDSFEIKVYGASGPSNKKSSIIKITTDQSVPEIFMKAGTVEMDSDLVVYPMGDYTTTIKQTGFMETGYLHVLGSTAGGKGSTYDGNLYVGGLLTLNGGLSAGCGVTFNCLTHFMAGLSGSGATLGRLVVNSGISAAGGSTFDYFSIRGITPYTVTGFNGTTSSSNVSEFIEPNITISSIPSSRIDIGSYSNPLISRTVGGATISSVYGYVGQPKILDMSSDARFFGIAGLFNLVRGSSTDFSSNASNSIVGVQASASHGVALPESAYSASVIGQNPAANIYSGTANTLQPLLVQSSVGSLSTSKGCTANILYGLQMSNTTVGHASTGKSARIGEWYQIWLGRGITAGLGTIGSRWGIYQTDRLNGNYFAGSVQIGTTALSAALGVSGSSQFTGLASFNSGISAAGGITLSGTVFVGATLSMNSNIQLNQNFRIFGGVVDGGVYT